MEIYLLRHAKAVEHGAPGYLDEERPLTEDGISRMREAAAGIARIVPRFDLILASPLERAFHTARIVAESFQDGPQPEKCNHLVPGASAKGLFAHLSKHNNKQRVLLVGHEPDLGRIASALLGAGNVIMELKKGGMCHIDVPGMPPETPGMLVWSASPKMLRWIAEK